MLKFIFQWLDLHPGSYWLPATAASLLLVARLGFLIGRDLRAPAKRGSADWRDGVVLFLFLHAWRWPFLFAAAEFNPDESQLAAGALTLARDPVFWRAVDGGSSGPLNYYFLMPWRWFGVPLDYFTVRLTGLLLVWGTLFTCLRTLATTFGRPAAWLGVLPAATFFATVTHPDFIHYSAEHLPLLFTAVSCGLLAGRTPPDRKRLWMACILAGALPWTKLQTAPIGLALLGWAGWQVLREPGVAVRLRWRQAAGVLLAAALPTLLLTALFTTTGQTEAVLRRYFLQNLLYVGNGSVTGKALGIMIRDALLDGRFPLFIGTALTGLLAMIFYVIRHRMRPSDLLVAGSGVTLAALAAVIAPRREFLHYVLLLPVPLTLCYGAAVGACWHHLATVRSRLVLAVLGLAAGLLPLITRGLQPAPGIFGNFADNWRHPHSSTAVVLRALVGGSDETLGVWGWASHLYVETGLPQATRDGTSLWSIEPNAQQAYHRSVYLADLRRQAPAVFVDAVGQGAFTFEDRIRQAHENFPELADYIRQNYTLIVDLRDARIYARNGLAAIREMGPTRLWHLVAQGRGPGPLKISPPLSSLDQLQHKTISQRRVTMLLPPTRVAWWLDEDVREVSFDFGYDHVAYEQGRSNGTELILELVRHQYTRMVYRRFLDPARQPQDRGPQTARVTLPPFAPGTTLQLRTDPGPHGDDAWDWVYLAGLELLRNPVFLPQQFPGFTRVPDSADGATATILEEGPKRLFMLHAPGSLTYSLRGSERQLRFNFGFRPGAYSEGGQTDGAIYRVELQSTGRPVRIIFERFLQPRSREEDRGPQHAWLTLPPLLPGDDLTLIIDPGPAGNVAWDWTYISAFDLR